MGVKSLLGSLFRLSGFLVVIVSSYFLFDYFHRRRKYEDKVRRVRRILDGRLGRPLEYYDALLEHGQLRGHYLLSIAFFFEGVAPLKESALTKALWRVAAANPMLRLRIDALDGEQDENGFPKCDDLLYFVEMEEFRLNFEALDTDNWLGVLEKDICEPIDSRVGPLWRVKKLQGSVTNKKHKSVIIATFHHGIIDSKSLMVFGDQLVKELIHQPVDDMQSALAQTLPTFYKEIVAEDFRKLPSLTQAMLYLLGKWMKTFNVMPLAPACSFFNFTPRPEGPSQPPARLRMIPLQLSASELNKVRRRCDRNRCNLRATLQAAVNFAQVKTLNEIRLEGVKLPDPLEIRNYFLDSRKFWNPSAVETIGFEMWTPWIWFRNQVGGILEIWSLARKSYNCRHTRSIDLFRVHTILNFFYRIFPDWLMRNNRLNVYHIDNALMDLGVFFDGRAERWPIDIVGAYASRNGARSDHCFVHCVFSIRGRLFWTISFDECVFSAELGAAFAENVEAMLRKIVKGRSG